MVTLVCCNTGITTCLKFRGTVLCFHLWRWHNHISLVNYNFIERLKDFKLFYASLWYHCPLFTNHFPLLLHKFHLQKLLWCNHRIAQTSKLVDWLNLTFSKFCAGENLGDYLTIVILIENHKKLLDLEELAGAMELNWQEFLVHWQYGNILLTNGEKKQILD